MNNNNWKYILVVTLFSLVILGNCLGLLNNLFPSWLCPLKAFDPVLNFQKVLSLPVRRPDSFNLEFFEGIRALATLAVVYAH